MGDSDSHLIEAMAAYMTRCMAGHDPSHNPAHVHRVVSLAHRILAGETAGSNPNDKSKYNKRVVTLAALLHDIGDHKYLPPYPLPRDAPDTTTTSNASSMATTFSGSSPPDPTTQLVYKALTDHGADEELASRVQTIVSNVSYTNEIRNPARVQSLIATPGYHELAIVQDADRLDAIGAVGIARTFTYLGSQGPKRAEQSGPWELEESIKHFEEKLEKLESMMKTETGRKIARERTRRLKVFKEWWIDETASLDA